MSRSQTADVLVLNLSAFGEGHRNVAFLVKDEKPCILHATLFGGAKTKKHGGLGQFQTGKVWLYFNPIKQSYKITDFESKVLRTDISENLVRIWCASFLSELCLKMHGNVDWLLANAFLDGINISSEEECRVALLRFIWRMLLFTGVAPDFEYCSNCETNFEKSNIVAHYLPANGTIICEDCIEKKGADFLLSNESIQYLKTVRDELPGVSRRKKLSKNSFGELKSFLFFLIQETLGQKLKTLESGIL